MPDDLGININYDGLLQHGLFPTHVQKGVCSAGNSVRGTLRFVVRPPCPPPPAFMDNVCPTRLEQRWNNFVS